MFPICRFNHFLLYILYLHFSYDNEYFTPCFYASGLFSAIDLKSLIEESMIMSNFNHPNVMKLIGVCIDSKDTPYVIMPYMTHGSLLSYLRKNREQLSVTNDSDLVSYAIMLLCKHRLQVVMLLCMQLNK